MSTTFTFEGTCFSSAESKVWMPHCFTCGRRGPDPEVSIVEQKVKTIMTKRTFVNSFGCYI